MRKPTASRTVRSGGQHSDVESYLENCVYHSLSSIFFIKFKFLVTGALGAVVYIPWLQTIIMSTIVFVISHIVYIAFSFESHLSRRCKLIMNKNMASYAPLSGSREILRNLMLCN